MTASRERRRFWFVGAAGGFGPSAPASPKVRLRYEIRTRARRSVLETDGSNHHACHRRNICAIAEQNNMAIAAFNTSSLEAVRAAIDAAEATGDPVPPRVHGRDHGEVLRPINP